MIYASVCSGVEAASLAWMPLGWKAAWFSEIEPFPCAVLKHRFPEVPNLGDMTKIKVETIENETGKLQRFKNESGADVVVPGGVDLLVGGTPCQSFSVAGNRAGLRGVSGLALTYCRLLETMHPRWFVWENVPGVFSSNGGEDFKTLLKAFDDIGYSCAWRVLDAQYVRVDGYPRAVPQRRRRVFVVGHFGSDFRCPAGVLFEPESVFRNTPPRRTKGQTAPAGAEGGIDTAKSIRMRCGKPGGGKGALIGDDLSHTLATGNDQTVIYTVHGAQTPISNDDHANALGCSNSGLENCVCVSEEMKPESRFWNGEDVAGTLTVTSDRQLMPDKGRLQCVIEPREGSAECLDIRHVDSHDTDLAPTLIATDYKGGKAICYENHAQDSRIKPVEVSQSIVARMGTGGGNLPLVKEPDVIGFIKNDARNRQGVGWQATVRKLLPIECERLMGFPDNWTRIRWKGRPEEECPDAPRYKACGNSMCVNVMRWIGMRIELTERKLK